MVVFGISGCIQAKWLHWGKVVVFEQKLLYSDNVVVFRKGGLGERWLYSGKSGCIREACF